MKDILNFRSLADFKTKENATIQPDKIFRSAAPEYGTPEDFSKLQTLQLDAIIDFREEAEKRLLLEENFHKRFNRISAAIDVANFFNHEEIKKTGLNLDNIDYYYNNIYEKLPTHFHSQYQIFTHSLNKGDTLLFHCSAGKDRTGFAAYLALSALGVHSDDIMEDYLISNRTALALYESRKNETNNLEINGSATDIIQRLFGVQEEYLDTAIKTIEETYKNCDNYLTKILQADINSIRTHYLT